MIKQAKKIKNGSQNNIKYLNQDIKKIKLKKNEIHGSKIQARYY